MFAHASLARLSVSVCILAAVITLPAAATAAHERAGGLQHARDDDLIRGAVVGAAKTFGDTILVLGPQGSGATWIGDFENGSGLPAWNGWTSADLSVLPTNPWHVDSYNVISGVSSAWCGDAGFPSCGDGDPAGGYGNGYRAVLEWRGHVADPGLPCTVTVGALANLDLEPGYDFAYLEMETAGGALELWSSDGLAVHLAIGGSHTYQPGDYVGDGADEVLVRFRVATDEAYSDEDCLFPSRGAMQLDDVVVTLDNGTGMSHDFEDGTLGPLTKPLPVPVGDFAQLWSGLEDGDRCATNSTPQVAFIDDGLVVPGTGGAPCITWCYGPSGWIVNTTGGLAGPGERLRNAVMSPVMAWPDPARDGALLSFDVYEHQLLTGSAPGIFWTWWLRSAPGSDPADLESTPWRNAQFLYAGGPGYERWNIDVTGLLAADRGQVQVRLEVLETNWYGLVGDDGTPAPYFDNVRFEVFDCQGPALAAREYKLAQDAFPAAGAFDPADPGAASVRFDMARNIAPQGFPIDAGDSVVITAQAVRSGAALAGPPLMHYRLRRNPAFDPWRTSGLPDQGAVACDSARTSWGAPLDDTWCADLPDTGFLFPGDVLHYCFVATDGVGADLRTALLPADTTGFSDFDLSYGLDRYDARFTVRALPSVSWTTNPEYPAQPEILLWFDARADAAWDRWDLMLRQLCLVPGRHLDVFTTRAAASGVGNGLGARASLADLQDYDAIIYTAGDLAAFTLNTGAGSLDPSPDLPLLAAWLDLGDKGLYAGGDGLAGDLDRNDPGGQFLSDRCGARFVADDIRDLIGNQYSPVARGVPGDPAFVLAESWVLNGDCPDIRMFDAVTATGGGVRAAEFTDPSGGTGAYTYAAAVRRTDPVSGSRCLLTPWDLARVAADPHGDPPWGGWIMGTIVLHDAFSWVTDYGIWFFDCISGAGDDTPRQRFGASAHPNPFNPRVSIEYTVARPGPLSVKIYDLRGRLVRVLWDGPVAGAGRLVWDGRDAEGAAAASGVYFYQLRMDNEVKVGKMALIR